MAAKIRLSEIPQDGRTYTYSRKAGERSQGREAELDVDLVDLIGLAPYEVELSIHPIGNAYEMRGSIATTVKETCSYCSYEFENPVNCKVNEILFAEEKEERKGHSVHGNRSVDFLAGGPAMLPYKGEAFDPGEYVHEAIALAQPFYPMCGPNETCLRAAEVDEIRRKLEIQLEAIEESTRANPAFAVLKDLNLDKKN